MAGTYVVCARRPLLVLIAVLFLASFTSADSNDILEVVDATARGTLTQAGQLVDVKLLITNYSTKQDWKQLDDAFHKGQNTGLFDALSKMKPVARIQIPGTLGSEIAFLTAQPTPTGRVIRFLTNRKITIGEAKYDDPSQAYNLTFGQIEINTQNPKLSHGIVCPAAQYVINSNGEMELQLRKDVWNLTNIVVRQVSQKK